MTIMIGKLIVRCKLLFFFQAEDGIRDYKVTWSSDVCSSDLLEIRGFVHRQRIGPRHAITQQCSSAEAACPLSQVARSEEHTSELQSPCNLVCRLLLEKKKKKKKYTCVCTQSVYRLCVRTRCVRSSTA